MNSITTAEAEFQRLKTESGRMVAGRKVGFANKAMLRVEAGNQVRSNMYDDMVHREIAELPIGRLALRLWI
jgi:2-keto-4-pentenoate hydratase